MNNKFSITGIAKKVGILGLLFAVSGAEAMKAEHMAAIDQKIEELAGTMHHAMMASGDYNDDLSLAQIRSSIKHHVGVRFINEMAPPEDAYILHEQKQEHQHHHHHKHHHASAAKGREAHSEAPRQQTFTRLREVDKSDNCGSKEQSCDCTHESRSQLVSVPIDEVKAITVKVSPTFLRDRVDSVTLKSFRKVIGYDTFNSILRGDRDEQKDPNDHYNITVSMMVVRIPEPAVDPAPDRYNGGESLAARLDKGFPYDDGDTDLSESTALYRKKPSASVNVGILNGQNITRDNLKNLLRDTTTPVTQSLFVQLDKGDGDNLSTLFDSNVTRGALKNLVTDKPAPITVKLAQKGDGDNLSTLFDSNVTRGALKNLVTDKPAPITVKLAQIQKKDIMDTFPEAVNEGDKVEGMNGTEEIHGPARVGGTSVAYKKRQVKTLSNKNDFPYATIDGDTVKGMEGNEEVYGPARVGGSQVRYNNNKEQKKNKKQDPPEGDTAETERGNRDTTNGDLSKKRK